MKICLNEGVWYGGAGNLIISPHEKYLVAQRDFSPRTLDGVGTANQILFSLETWKPVSRLKYFEAFIGDTSYVSIERTKIPRDAESSCTRYLHVIKIVNILDGQTIAETSIQGSGFYCYSFVIRRSTPRLVISMDAKIRVYSLPGLELIKETEIPLEEICSDDIKGLYCHSTRNLLVLIHADWRLYFYDLDLNRLKVLKLEPWELVGGEDPGDGLLEVNEDTSGKFLFARSWQVIFQVDCESLTLIHGYFLIFPKACGIRSVKWDRILRGLMVAAYFTYGKYREPLTPSQELIRDTPWLTPVIVPKADLQKMRDFNATERFFFCDIEARKLSLYPLQESIQTEIISFHKKFLQGVPVPLTIPEEDMAAKFSTPEFQQEFRYNLFMNFKNCYPLLYPLKNNTEFLCSKNGFLYRFGIDL